MVLFRLKIFWAVTPCRWDVVTDVSKKRSAFTLNCQQSTKCSQNLAAQRLKLLLHYDTHTHTHTRTHAHTHAHTHTRTHTHAHTHTHTHTRTHTRAHTHTRARTHARTHTRARTHTHTHTHGVSGCVTRMSYMAATAVLPSDVSLANN
jgi:hypothetical protein